jgi:hypothetical protein
MEPGAAEQCPQQGGRGGLAVTTSAVACAREEVRERAACAAEGGSRDGARCHRRTGSIETKTDFPTRVLLVSTASYVS